MNNKLFIGSLAWGITTEDIVAEFEKFGELVLENTKVVMDRETGKSRGFAFVEFVDAAAAADAMEKMNGAVIGGRPINVSMAKPKEEGAGRTGGFRSGGSRGGFGGGNDRRY